MAYIKSKNFYHRDNNPMPWKVIDLLLGKLTDTSIARQFGCSNSTLCDRRKILGIPRVPYKRESGLRRIIDYSLFGNLTDRQIAEQCQVASGTPGSARHRLGIPHTKEIKHCIICDREFIAQQYQSLLCGRGSCKYAWLYSCKAKCWAEISQHITVDTSLRLCIAKIAHFRRLILQKEGKK